MLARSIRPRTLRLMQTEPVGGLSRFAAPLLATAFGTNKIKKLRLAELTINPLVAHDRSCFKVEKVEQRRHEADRILYAGNNLDKARGLSAWAIKRRPRIRLRTRVLQQWPK